LNTSWAIEKIILEAADHTGKFKATTIIIFTEHYYCLVG